MCIRDRYTVTKLSSLVKKPVLPGLSHAVVRAVEKMANSDQGCDPSSDRARAALFGLPGAWPSPDAWEAKAKEWADS